METIRICHPVSPRTKPTKPNLRITASTHLVKVTTVLHDLVGDGAGLGESGDVLADTVEREVQSLGHGSGKLSLGLVTDNSKRSGLLGDGLLHVSRDLRVNTTAETTVGRHGEVEDLSLLGLLIGGLGLLKQH